MTNRRLRSNRFLPEYVSRFKDRHGKERLRFRRKGYPSQYFTAALGTEAFREEYRRFNSPEAATQAIEDAHADTITAPRAESVAAVSRVRSSLGSPASSRQPSLSVSAIERRARPWPMNSRSNRSANSRARLSAGAGCH